MDIQYLSDEQGRQTAIQIHIDEWNKLKEESKAFSNFVKVKTSQKKPSDFRGSISKNTAKKILEYVEQTRWR